MKYYCRKTVLATACIVYIAIRPISGYGGEDQLAAKLQAELPSATRKLQEFYTHLQLTEKQTGIHVERMHPGSKNSVLLRFDSHGRSLRYSQLDSNRKTLASIVATKEQSFRVARSNVDQEFELYELNQRSYDEQVQSLQFWGPKLPFAAYTIQEFRVVDSLIDNPGCESLSCTPVVHNDQSAVRVDFVYKPEPDEPADIPRYELRVILAPENSWALLKYESGTFAPTKNVIAGEITYDKVVDGIPIAKSADYWSIENGKRIDVLHAELVELKREPAPDKVFAPEAFGIVLGKSVERTNTPIWSLILGISGLVVAVLLAYLARRKSKSTRPTGS